MIRFSKRVEYALLFLSSLTQHSGEVVSLEKLARGKSLPVPFLSQIAFSLKGMGIIGSKEGRGGGYFLLKNLNDVSLFDLVDLLDGRNNLTACSAGESCSLEGVCELKFTMGILDRRLRRVLGSVSVGDVLFGKVG